MRKIILAIVGVVSAIYGMFGVSLGITEQVNAASIVGSLLIVAAYIFTEGRRDIQSVIEGIQQSNKWGDPAFWTSLIGAIVLPLSVNFGFVLNDATLGVISAILAILAPILVSLFRKTAPSTKQ